MANLAKLYPIAYTQGRTIDYAGHTLSFSIITAGLLSLPSGQIVACDPLIASVKQPFVQTVLPGRYPVDLSLARRESGDEYVALARITFTSRQPVVWVAAVPNGRHIEHGAEGGFQSESGTGAFLDATAVAEADFVHLDNIDALLLDLTGNYRHHRYWLEYPLADRRRNVVMFSTGRGSGTYRSFFGIDEAGDISVLVTDFQLIVI